MKGSSWWLDSAALWEPAGNLGLAVLGSWWAVLGAVGRIWHKTMLRQHTRATLRIDQNCRWLLMQ